MMMQRRASNPTIRSAMTLTALAVTVVVVGFGGDARSMAAEPPLAIDAQPISALGASALQQNLRWRDGFGATPALGSAPTTAAGPRTKMSAQAVRRAANASGVGSSLKFKDYRNVDGFLADLDTLSSTGRMGISGPLRIPNDFKGLFQIPKDAPTPYAGWFARMESGVIVVFQRGEYFKNKDTSIVPIVPAGSSFFIGSVPLTAPMAGRPTTTPYPGSISNAASTRIDLATDTRAAFPEMVQDARAKPGSAKAEALLLATDMKAFSLDPAYRAVRLNALLAGVSTSKKLQAAAEFLEPPDRSFTEAKIGKSKISDGQTPSNSRQPTGLAGPNAGQPQK